MGLRERAVDAAAWTMLQSWGGQASNLVIFVALARLLAPEDFGLVSYAGVFLVLIRLMATAGFTQAIVQRKHLEQEHLDSAFWVQIGISSALTVILFVASPFLGAAVGEPELAEVLRWLSPSLFLGAFSLVPAAQLRRALKMKPLALRTLAANVVGGVVGVVMAVSGWGVWSLVAQQLTATAASAVLLWGLTGWRPSFRATRRHSGELFNFGLNIVGIQLLRYLGDHVDRFIIGYVVGPAALGIYVVGFRAVRMVVDLLSKTLNSVSVPVFSKMQDDPERVRRALRIASEMNGMIVFPVYLGIASLAPVLVLAVFGEQWNESVRVMQLLSGFGVAFSVQMLFGPVVIAMGKPDWVLRIQLVGIGFGLVAILIGVRFGVLGVAAAVLLRSLVLMPCFALAARSVIGASLMELAQPYAIPAFAALALGATCWATREALPASWPGWGVLLVAGFAGSAVYAVLLILLAREPLMRCLDVVWTALPSSLQTRIPRPTPG